MIPLILLYAERLYKQMQSQVDYRFKIVSCSVLNPKADTKPVLFSFTLNPGDKVVLEKYDRKTGLWSEVCPEEVKKIIQLKERE